MATIRQAEKQDITSCAALLALLFSSEHEFAPNEALQQKGLELIISNPDKGRVFIAENQEGVIIGMVSLLFTISTFLGGRTALLEDMVVDPAHRQMGIASALLDHAIEYTIREGIERITLLTDHDNAIARKLYLSKGFEHSTMCVLRRLTPPPSLKNTPP